MSKRKSALGPPRVLTSGPGKGMVARKVLDIDAWLDGIADDPAFQQSIEDILTGPRPVATSRRPFWPVGGCVQRNS